MTMSKSMRSTEPNIIHVAVAIVVNSAGKILIARRPKGVHLEGLWEFPGGKVKSGESAFEALQREMKEEVGLHIKSARRLINIIHEYPEKTVQLDTWLCKDWAGEATGAEGQKIYWCALNELADFEFPAADHPIITALKLPSSYQISPDPSRDYANFLSSLETCFEQGNRLFQLRTKSLAANEAQRLIEPIKQLCSKYNAKWLINGEPDDARRHCADGVHLNSKRLLTLSSRPLDSNFLVAASCHNAEELAHAERINVDFAVLSPVKKTRSHPEVKPIGLDNFEELIAGINMPIYALGGMSSHDLESVWKSGGQGIAMIRSGWPVSE